LRHSVVREHDPQLVTIGDAGDLVREVPNLVSLGSISDEDRQATIYSAADLTVIPSLADNQPLVALEAMACGTPVVAFAVGGVPEVVREDETGVCVPAGDAGALATAIGGLLGDEELCRRLSEGARRYALERHRVEAYAQHYGELYSSLLDQRQREI
jgi:glycosyltransferase involved in cell wall biosynthesis